MPIQSRKEKIANLFKDLHAYRWKQIDRALFNGTARAWKDVSVLPKNIREELEASVPWISYSPLHVFESKAHDTYKAMLAGEDKLPFETVLMANTRDQWTVCVSSQVGCAMACTFCATGTMGLKRSLLSDEIIDQYRFWKNFLRERPALPQRISNIVFMGMGEPLANYENVKEAITTLIANTDLGPTHITVSSVGLLPQLEYILTDKTWPNVRIAISLHSADEAQRKSIMPTTIPGFLPRLAKWTKDYAASLGNRRLHITFEYVLLKGVNDGDEDARRLARFIGSTAARKINVIPYNSVDGKPFSQSEKEHIDRFKAILQEKDITVTQRRTMGQDIAAACGQLVTKTIDSTNT